MAEESKPEPSEAKSTKFNLFQMRSEPIGVLPAVGGKKSQRSLIYIISGIVGLVAVIIGLGVWAGWFAKVAQQPGTDEQNGIFGQLPLGGISEINNAYSGLSGKTCEHPNRRAIAVMLAGDPINRPLSGASQADMMFELPALTNGVTRLLGVYQCQEPVEIGSVRSARHDYLFLAEGIDAIMGHWGGSYHALNRIAVGEFQTINALQNPHNAYFRKATLPAPYNGFTTYERLWNALQKLGYRQETKFAGYEFKDDAPAAERPAGGTLTVGWPGAFRVSYEYESATNRYVRYWAGVKQVDAVDKQVVAPSAVIIMRATNQLAVGEGGYNEVGVEGTGLLEVYQDGKVIKGTWAKNELEKKDPVHFLNEQGNPIVFTRGQLWIMTVEPEKTVTWEPK